jgi:hypothetical protein
VNAIGLGDRSPFDSITRRQILAWCAQAIVIFTLAWFARRLVMGALIGHVPLRQLASGMMVLQWALLLGLFAYYGRRAGEERWWVGATAVILAFVFVTAIAPIAIMTIAAMMSGGIRMAVFFMPPLAIRLLRGTLPSVAIMALIGVVVAFASSRTAGRAPVRTAGNAWIFAGTLVMWISVLTVAGSVAAGVARASSDPLAAMAAESSSEVAEPVRPQRPARALEVEIRELMNRQEIHFFEKGHVYAAHPDSLEWDAAGVRVDIAFAGDMGWAGSVTDVKSKRSCAVAIGSVPDDVRIRLVGGTRRPDSPVCKR